MKVDWKEVGNNSPSDTIPRYVLCVERMYMTLGTYIDGKWYDTLVQMEIGDECWLDLLDDATYYADIVWPDPPEIVLADPRYGTEGWPAIVIEGRLL